MNECPKCKSFLNGKSIGKYLNYYLCSNPKCNSWYTTTNKGKVIKQGIKDNDSIKKMKSNFRKVDGAKDKRKIYLSNDNYVVIDIETTGLIRYGKYPDIIQLSMLRVSKGEVVKEFNEYYNTKIKIDQNTTKIHGIDNAFLQSYSYLNNLKKEKIKEFMNEANIIVGHNIKSFDIPILNYHIDNYFDRFKITDTLYLSRKIYKDLPNHKLETVYNHVKIKSIDLKFHDSYDDIKASHMIYESIFKLIKKGN